MIRLASYGENPARNSQHFAWGLPSTALPATAPTVRAKTIVLVLLFEVHSDREAAESTLP